MTLRSFSHLIGHLYAGALEPSSWKAALEALRIELGANYVTLAFVSRGPRKTEATLSAGDVPLDRLVLYQNEYERIAPRPERRVGEIRTINAWRSSADHESLGRFEELLELSDIEHYMGAFLASNEDVDCVLRVTRGASAPEFSADDAALLELVSPHFARALELRARLVRAETRMEIDGEAMDRLSVGAIVLDAAGRVVAKNRAAERWSGDAAGAGPSLAQIVERARSVSADVEGKRLVFTSVARPDGRPPLGLAVCPMRLGMELDGSPRAGLAIFVRDPERPLGIAPDALVALYGLTRAQAGLALSLARGESLEAAAEELGIRYNTARAHLRAIFERTGVTRQAELVRLVLTGVAVLGDDQ